MIPDEWREVGWDPGGHCFIRKPNEKEEPQRSSFGLCRSHPSPRVSGAMWKCPGAPGAPPFTQSPD